MEPTKGLNRGEATRGMHHFINASAFWGAWGQAAGIGTAVFTGYALLLGADESLIALLTSMAYLLGLTQLLSPLISAKLGNTKRFIVLVGYAEIALRSSPALIPFFLPTSLQLPGLVLLVGLSLVCGHAISPSYSTWVSNTVPANIRARFTARQTIISSAVAILVGFAMGKFLDIVPDSEKQPAFIFLFAFAALCGWFGYFTLGRAPYPRAQNLAETKPTFKTLVQPFKNTNFFRAALFYGSWTFSLGIAGSLYSVFMIDRLKIPYTEISFFNALFMLTSIGGYRLWSVMVDRFGPKPILQILTIPASFIPFLWIFNNPHNYYMIPVALVMSGVLFSGIMVAITPMLYGLLPEGEERPFYLAAWSASVYLLGAMGPLVGSFLVRYLKDVDFQWLGFSFGSLQVIFIISAALRIAPIGLLYFVKDTKGVSSMRLLSQLRRGNLLSYAYNATLYNMASGAETRARATLALGRSGNPLALDHLLQALRDASPLVRRNAARALGETDSEQALETLVKELEDPESDVRSEAAESLGKLGYPGSIDPLINALDDPDPRVRISAIRGMAEIGSEEVQELLFWQLGASFDPLTHPTLVDVLGGFGDTRIIKPTLQHLSRFRSPAIRLQLLNSVCRALGTKSNFYRLLSLEDTKRIGELSRLLKRTGTRLGTSRSLDSEVRAELNRCFERLVQAYENANTAWMEESIRQITGLVRDGFHASGHPVYEALSVYIVILAINSLLDSPVRNELGEAQDIFFTICLERLAALANEIEDR